MPRTDEKHEPLRIAVFNLRGVLVHHRTLLPLPLVGQLLDALARDGWLVLVTSSDNPSAARRILDALDAERPPLLFPGCRPESLLRDILRQHPQARRLVYVDDCPANLAKQPDKSTPLELVGLAGSDAYTHEGSPKPRLPEFCAQSRSPVRFAFNTTDLACYFGVPLGIKNCQLSFEERAWLLPGTGAVKSPNAGGMEFAEHLMAPFKGQKEWDLAAGRLAWVCSYECMWSLMRRAAVAGTEDGLQNYFNGLCKNQGAAAALKEMPGAFRCHFMGRLRLVYNSMLDGCAMYGFPNVQYSHVSHRDGRKLEKDRFKRLRERLLSLTEYWPPLPKEMS